MFKVLENKVKIAEPIYRLLAPLKGLKSDKDWNMLESIAVTSPRVQSDISGQKLELLDDTLYKEFVKLIVRIHV